MMRAPRLGVAMVACLLLAGCGEAHLDALERQLQTLRQKPEGKIAALPEMPSYSVASYHGSAMRSPFAPAGQALEAPVSPAEPREQRERQPLEAFALENLALVGTLSVGDTPSGLIRAPDGRLYRVFVGDYLGRDQGHIVKITRRSLSLVERVRDSQGAWRERTRRLSLAATGEQAAASPQNSG
ncbi:pilus assembly protein PilP [Salinicola tamaricis]|uniref:pilus assembly protein PilP n=1 Tax=Salinicola tamaricis TaxID=1771309 RepID=UPI000D0A54AB|nr:pilus assembly protein PilP [Salinicola tamaricis]